MANTSVTLNETPNPSVELTGIVDATKIALEELGIPAINTCLLGSFAATTGWVRLESIVAAIEEYFANKPKLAEKNCRSAERGFREVTVTKW